MASNSISTRVLREPTDIDLSLERTAALFGLLLVTASSLTVLYEITTILGGTGRLLLHVALAIVLAWAAARYLTPRGAWAIFGGLAVASYLWYFLVVVGDLWMMVEAPVTILIHSIDDTVAIATGQSVLAIVATDVWATSFAPAPLFLTWYFGFRRRYLAAAITGGATMTVFVFSGDLGVWTTLIGTIGIVMVVGFGTIERTDASSRYSEGVVVLITAMAVVALLVPLVPGGGALGPLSFVDAFEADDELPTLEENVVGGGERLEIIGEINTNPEIRFVVNREEPVYLRTGIYDLYTGSGWERTIDSGAFESSESLPPNTQAVYQAIRVETETDRMPAAGEPISVFSIDTDITTSQIDQTDGAIFATGSLQPGDKYGVISAVPQLPENPANVTAPDDIDDRYLQLPETVPDGLYAFTDELLADAQGPLEKAQLVESLLEDEKEYSHDVSVPDGDLAAGFLFDMNSGYCTYFATTAVTMLRAADVPARMAVGYANGQNIDDTTSVIRGMNSHAWVEVYVAEYGWIPVDPTPAGEWSDERQQILEDARVDDIEGIDTNESTDLPFNNEPESPFGEGDPTDPDDDDGNETGNDTNGTTPTPPEGNLPGVGDDRPDPGSGSGNNSTSENYPNIADYRDEDGADSEVDEGSGILGDLGLEHVALLGITTTGAIIGMRRLEVPRRIRRQRRLRWHRKPTAPAVDLHRSAERLEWAMERRFRPRHPGETLRAYHRRYTVVNDDERVDDLFAVIEDARYGGVADAETATTARQLANDVVDDTVVFGGRLRPTIPRGERTVADRIL